MTNPYYTATGAPIAQSRGASSTQRSEFLSVQGGFDAVAAQFVGFTGAVFVTGVDGGAANAYTLTPANALVAYSSKMLVEFTPNADCTGSATLNISGLGAKPIITQAGIALTAGDLASGRSYLAAYDGTSFRLISVTTAYVDAVRTYATQLAFQAALPAQAGNAGKYIRTDGVTASWSLENVVREARSSNTPLCEADAGKWIDITSGTFTQTFDAAATLGNGWYCWIRNSGAGDITVTLDGLTYAMFPGEFRLAQCDGTTLTSVVLNGFSKVFTSTATFPKPPGYNYFEGEVFGAGASGAKGSTGGTASGGGGGACCPFKVPSALVAATEVMTVAAGGAAVSTTTTAGNAGGTSSFGSLVFSYGGGAGGSLNSLSDRGGGGGGGIAGTGGTGQSGNAGGGLPAAGGAGSTDSGFGGGSSSSTGTSGRGTYGGGAGGQGNGSGPGGAGASSTFGGAGGGGAGNTSSGPGITTAGAGGVSTLGGNGGAASQTGSGVAGSAPGGGGGATQTGASSGAGARGEIRIRGVL